MTNQTRSKVNKHGLIQGGLFMDEFVCKNMENHLASKGSLDNMFILKPKKEAKNGTVSIPIKYVPDPDGDKKEYDLQIYSKDIFVYGKIYNEEKKFAPELKHAKFTQSGFDKHEKDDMGFVTKLRAGETIEEEDVNYNFRIREMLNKFLNTQIEHFHETKKWGNPQDKDYKGKKKPQFDVIVPNFDLKDGLNTKTFDFEDRPVPYVTFKFSEDEGVISSSDPNRVDYKLKILDKNNNVLEVTRDNINQTIPSKSKVRMVVSHKDIKISKFGISLTRYINKFRIEEASQSKRENFSFDDDEEELVEDMKKLDFDDDD